MIMNAMDKYGQLGSLDLQAMVTHNGRVEWFVGDRRRTSCKVVVTRFPLDAQECWFRVVQWATTVKEVAYVAADDPMTFTTFEKNGEWNISSYRVLETYTFGGKYKRINFIYIFDRRRAYYVISAILPVCILSLLNLFVFRVPPESGEKLSLCVSVLLSFAVYLTSINESLPEVSDHIALFSVYLNVMFALKALSVMATVCVLYLFHTPPRPGSRLRRWLFLLLRVHRQKIASAYSESISLNDAPNTKMAVDTITQADMEAELDWKIIIKRLDLVFFYIFLALFLFFTLGVFLLIGNM